MNQAKIIDFLTNSYPQIKLKASDNYLWSPSERTVFYKPDNSSDEAIWSLLHECGHAILNHSKYYSDFELVMIEIEAWEKAKEIANEINIYHSLKSPQDSAVWSEERESQAKRTKSYGERESQGFTQNVHSVEISIDEDHIQDCLDTYRDWLHRRSLCPNCNLSGIQHNENVYACIFCYKRWKVTSDRFCRPYRRAL